MTATVLVVGADRVDAGKTTFSTGLLARTGGRGYKPRAGNDYWFDHDDCLASLAEGRLHGKDAAALADAERGDRTPEELNPIHRLWRPAPAGGSGLLGRSDREFVVDRVGERFVVNAEASVPDRVAEALALEDAPRVGSVRELNELTEARYLPLFDELAREVRSAEFAVVESYGEVALPLDCEPAAVAAVEPGRVRLYRGDRYLRACEVATSAPREGRMERRVGDVVDYIDPVGSRRLPALSSRERADPERVADAYGEVYDALLELLEGR
ncbi:ATPase [Saliphagus infecundisoli]|uniref:ATPase n=1 Tax=Saliphagus infecundisoli TaxID=1849069 RepID=A0ABD5QHQ5_9EURY|nr:ATPase [Saliphagus infecundisoli]